MKRNEFLRGAALTGAALAGARLPAAAATGITTQFLWVKNVEYAGYWIADADGYFRKEGLAPTFLAGGPNIASPEAMVAGGRADVGIDELEKVVDAVDRGADFVVIGAIFQGVVGGILSLPKNPVRKPADLVGKRIGLAQGDRDYIDGILRLNHLPLNYTEVPVGFDPEPLVEGACDALLCYVTSQPLELKARHIPYVLISLTALGYYGYAGTLFTPRAYATRNRDTLVRYLRALGHGWLTNTRDPRRAAQLAVDQYGASLGLDLQQQIAQNEAQIPLTQSAQTRRYGPIWISPEIVGGRVYRSLRAMGRSTLPAVDRLVDVSYLRAANAGWRHW